MNGLSGAQHSLHHLRQEFKQLQRKARRLKSHEHRVWYPTDEIKAQAVLIMILTDETRWAIVWVQQWQRKWIRWALATPGQVSSTMLQTWCAQFADSAPVVAALQSLAHPWRVRVDCFLMETLLYEEIMAQNEKGLVMPANTVPAMFIHKWSMRPRPPCIDEVIGSMRTDAGAYKKQWGRKFRTRWMLSVTEFVPKTLMDTDERQFRVPRPNKSGPSMSHTVMRMIYYIHVTALGWLV